MLQLYTITTCLFAFAAILLYKLHIPNFHLSPKPLFKITIPILFISLSLILTFIDKPPLNLSPETIDWLFMFSAFLGVPLLLPLLSSSIYSLFSHLHNKKLSLPSIIYLSIFTLFLGCAASSIRDIIWCATHSNFFSTYDPGGYDLSIFFSFGSLLGVTPSTTQNYSTFGQYSILLFICEILLSYMSYKKLINEVKK